MKRYAFPLTIILLLFAVIALAAPGDKRPAVTSAAIGLGTSSSATMASVTATTSVTAPSFNSTAADGYHYVLPYNSVAFAGTPSVGMMQTTPTGPQWYTGSAWEAIGSGGGGTWGSITGTLSAQTDLQAALNAKASTGYVDTAIAGVTAGTIPFVSDTTPPSAENTINYSRSDHKFRFRYPNGDVYVSAAMTLETAADTTPAAFAFTDETGVALSTAKTSDAITVAGTNYPAAISVTGDTGYGYSKNSAACTATSGTVVAGDTVAACVTSSGSNSTATTATITIGGVSDTYSVTTVAGGASYSDGFTYSAGLLTTANASWPAVTGWTSLTVTSGGQLQGTTNANYANYYSGATFASNQCSKVSIPTMSGYGVGPMVRVQTGAATAYEVQTVSATTLRVRKFVAGSGSTLGTDITGLAVADGDTVEICANGSSTVDLTVYQNNNLVGTRTDSSSVITGGYPGIYMYGTGARIDNTVLRDL